MKRLASLLPLLLLLAAPLPAEAQAAAPSAASAPDSAAQNALIERAAILIHRKKAAEAIPLLDQVIAAQEKANTGEKRQVYSAQSTT